MKVLFFVALFAMVAWTQAQLIWVRPFNLNCPAGCPACNGSFACRLAAIQDALTLLPWGGTIRLFSGVYIINDPALTAGSFTIQGNGTQTFVDCEGAPGFRVFNSNAQFSDFIIGSCARLGGNGGAFSVQGAFARFSFMQIVSSNADRGGGIYVENGSVSLENGTNVNNNIAAITGGGLFLTSASANLGDNVNIRFNLPNDIRCVMSSFNGGTVDVSSCLNCGACTTP